MRKPRKEISFTSYDDIFGNSDSGQAAPDQIMEIPLEELHTFKDHPFRVVDDEKMEETVESICKYGVLVPGIARPREDGGYEIIAGHRRKHGSELAGKATMPMMVRDYTDDEATIIMVDSNIQREDILPSEKAKAYSMKYEALKHQGQNAGGRTLSKMGEEAGESAKTVQRYIWLSRLTEELMELVDLNKLGFTQGVDISFLKEEAQQWVTEAVKEDGCKVSSVQSAQLKEYDKNGELTKAMVKLLLSEEKPKQRKVVLKQERLNSYFPDSYTQEDMENVIFDLLEKWKEKGGLA